MAASFQGKKRGRQFLLILQNALIKENINYNNDLVKNAALRSNLDLEIFMEDRNSSLAKKTFRQEQQVAKSLGVKEAATAVVFDSDQSQYGFLLNNFDYDTLINAYQNRHLEDEISLTNFIKNYQSHSQIRTVQK